MVMEVVMMVMEVVMMVMQVVMQVKNFILVSKHIAMLATVKRVSGQVWCSISSHTKTTCEIRHVRSPSIFDVMFK